MHLPCSIGITAYNEEANIGKLLKRLQQQQLALVTINEIIVVASGCTDRTEEIVLEMAADDPRIRLLSQPEREGKASAINLFLRQTTDDVLVLSSADLLPAIDAIENLVLPFMEPRIGITGGHPVPVDKPDTFMGYGVNLLWELHHDINMSGGFKAGEMIAFRRLFEMIDAETAVDEASIEQMIRAQGYEVQYVAEAIVHNKGADSIPDFIRQRRRIHAGHLAMTQQHDYSVSTMSSSTILRALLMRQQYRLIPLLWTVGIVGLEGIGRFLGWVDHKRNRSHTVWEIAESTKQLE